MRGRQTLEGNSRDLGIGKNLGPAEKPAGAIQGCYFGMLSISKQTQWVAQAQVGSLSSQTRVPGQVLPY